MWEAVGVKIQILVLKPIKNLHPESQTLIQSTTLSNPNPLVE